MWAALLHGSLGFGGEESPGASFLRQDGRVWTTDKDGIGAGLLAAELTARRGAIPVRRIEISRRCWASRCSRALGSGLGLLFGCFVRRR